jgi:hypothetical protein
MKCLWIFLELSEKYFYKKLNIAKFATSRDTMINAHFLALPTIFALQSSHNMRFEEQSKLPGNHVTCYWQGQIIDYEYKRSYPLTLDNLHFTCGETLQFEGIALGYSIIPKPHMMSVKHWPKALMQKLFDSQDSFHNLWNHDDVYQVKKVRRKRKR